MSVFNKQEWVAAVDDLKAKAAEFMSLFAVVQNSTAQTPALAAQRESALNKASIVQGTIDRVTRAIDWTYALWDNLFGDETDNTLKGLGLLPLVPIAVITGAVAAITYSVADFKKYLDENNRIEQLRNEGYSTEQAIDIASQSRGIAGSIERALKSYGPWIAAGVVVYMMSQKRFNF